MQPRTAINLKSISICWYDFAVNNEIIIDMEASLPIDVYVMRPNEFELFQKKKNFNAAYDKRNATIHRGIYRLGFDGKAVLVIGNPNKESVNVEFSVIA